MTLLRRLERNLKIQQHRYNRALQQLQQAQAQLGVHQQQLDYLMQMQSEYACVRGMTLTPLALLNRRDFIGNLQQISHHQRQQVVADQQQCHHRSQRLLAEKQKLDELKRRLAQHRALVRADQERAEQAQVDDLFSSRYRPAAP